jgi:hypothetical protein
MVERMAVLERENRSLTRQIRTLAEGLQIVDEQKTGSMARIQRIEKELELALQEKQLGMSREIDQAFSQIRDHYNGEIAGLNMKMATAMQQLEIGNSNQYTQMDGELQGLKRAIYQQRQEQDGFKSFEKQKGNYLVDEVKQISNQYEISKEELVREHAKLEERLIRLEQIAMTSAQQLQQVEARENSVSVGLNSRSDAAASQLQALSHDVAQLQAQLQVASTQTRQTTTDQHGWVQQFQAALQRTDLSVQERLFAAMNPLVQQTQDDKQQIVQRMDMDRERAVQQEAQRAAAEGESREMISSRFVQIESGLHHERAERERHHQEGIQRVERNLVEQANASAVSAREQTTQDLTVAMDEMHGELEDAMATLGAKVDGCMASCNNLEEVVRAEIRGRLAGENKGHTQMEKVAAQLAEAIDMVQQQMGSTERKWSQQLVSTDEKHSALLMNSLKELLDETNREKANAAKARQELHTECNAIRSALEKDAAARTAAEAVMKEAMEAAIAQTDEGVASLRGKLDRIQMEEAGIVEEVRVTAAAELHELAAQLHTEMKQRAAEDSTDQEVLRRAMEVKVDSLADALKAAEKASAQSMTVEVRRMEEAQAEQWLRSESETAMQAIKQKAAEQEQTVELTRLAENAVQVQVELVLSRIVAHVAEEAGEDMRQRTEHYLGSCGVVVESGGGVDGLSALAGTAAGAGAVPTYRSLKLVEAEEVGGNFELLTSRVNECVGLVLRTEEALGLEKVERRAAESRAARDRIDVQIKGVLDSVCAQVEEQALRKEVERDRKDTEGWFLALQSSVKGVQAYTRDLRARIEGVASSTRSRARARASEVMEAQAAAAIRKASVLSPPPRTPPKLTGTGSGAGQQDATWESTVQFANALGLPS